MVQGHQALPRRPSSLSGAKELSPPLEPSPDARACGHSPVTRCLLCPALLPMTWTHCSVPHVLAGLNSTRAGTMTVSFVAKASSPVPKTLPGTHGRSGVNGQMV